MSKVISATAMSHLAVYPTGLLQMPASATLRTHDGLAARPPIAEQEPSLLETSVQMEDVVEPAPRTAIALNVIEHEKRDRPESTTVGIADEAPLADDLVPDDSGLGGPMPIGITFGSGMDPAVWWKPGVSHCWKRLGRLTTRNNDLELAHSAVSAIDLPLLASDDPHMALVLAPLVDPTAFNALITGNNDRVRRPLSRGMLQHLEALERQDQVEQVKQTDTAWQPEGCIITCFLVPKTNGQGRFIADCRPLNRRMPKPPPMGLPRLPDAVNEILSYEVAAKTDGVGYFNQFLLHPATRHWFTLRLAGKRI